MVKLVGGNGSPVRSVCGYRTVGTGGPEVLRSRRMSHSYYRVPSGVHNVSSSISTAV